MGLRFVGIDPDTGGDNCPAVFVDEETGDFLLQGWTITDHGTLARDLCVPANDFWVFDDRLVRFGYFAGDGTFLEHELSDDPSEVTTCAEAFEAIWEHAIPHSQYRPS